MADAITIVFPSFNRGHKLRPSIDNLLPALPANVNILVLDNGSDAYSEDYSAIETLASDSACLRYVKNETNILFEGNFARAFDVTDANYIMFVSDEDTPNLDFIDDHMSLFEQSEALGAIRPSIGTDPHNPVPIKNAHQYEEKYFEPSLGALCEFGLTGNYLSGAIYNRLLINRAGLRAHLNKNLFRQPGYPHLYLNCLVSTHFATQFMSDVSVFEGEPVEEASEEPLSYGHLGTLSYGHRLETFIASRAAISDALRFGGMYSDDNFFMAYLHLVQKYLVLIVWVNGRSYQDLGNLEILALTDSFLHFCISAVKLHKAFPDYAGWLETSIHKMKDEVFKLAGVTAGADQTHSFE